MTVSVCVYGHTGQMKVMQVNGHCVMTGAVTMALSFNSSFMIC